MAFKYSFQLYTSRFFPPLSAQLPVLKDLGYEAVEPFMPLLDEPEEFRRQIDGAGLKCSGFHAHYQDLVADPQRFVDLADMLGTDLIIPPWLAPQDRPTSAEGWKRIGEKLAGAADAISGSGKRIAWHNHDFEFVPLADGSMPLTHLFGASGDAVGLELDLAWVVRAGADPAQALRDHKERIWVLQPKDTAPLGTKAEDGWTAPGKGILDWPGLWPLMRATGVDYLVVEHDNPADWVQLARDAIMHLKKMDETA